VTLPLYFHSPYWTAYILLRHAALLFTSCKYFHYVLLSCLVTTSLWYFAAGATSFSGREATAAGWGWLHETSALGGRADVLQKVTLLVVDNETCRDWYKSKGKKTKILDSQMCAGYEQGGRDSCWVRNSADCRSELLALLILVVTKVNWLFIIQ
jgi:hypothetical protein